MEGEKMESTEAIQVLAAEQVYSQPGSREVIRGALRSVQDASHFLRFDAERLTPMECQALSRALDQLIPVLTPIILRLNK